MIPGEPWNGLQEKPFGETNRMNSRRNPRIPEKNTKETAEEIYGEVGFLLKTFQEGVSREIF